MIKLTGKFLLIMAALCFSFVFAGCGGSTAVDNAPPNTAKTNNTAKTDTAKTDTAPAGDKTGVPECDEYIEKYEACLTSIADKYPQVHPGLKTSFEQQRKAFKDAASTPQGKAALGPQCKQAMETAKQATSTAYSCKW